LPVIVSIPSTAANAFSDHVAISKRFVFLVIG
jgi:hypothetical protein